MGVKEQMIATLRNSETRRIEFTFASTTGQDISIDRTTFERVAAALQRDEITVSEGRFSDDTAMYSARTDLRRHSAANTFYLGNNPRFSRSFDALIVHESVHASFDLTRSSLQWVDNETAAYIAQGFYLRNSGYQRSRLELGALAAIGYDYIGDIRDNEGDGTFFLNALREQLRVRPMYHDYIAGRFDGNG